MITVTGQRSHPARQSGNGSREAATAVTRRVKIEEFFKVSADLSG